MKRENKLPNVRGQLNRDQFVASILAGFGAGATAVLLHVQQTIPDWAGPYAPIALAVVSSLLLGLNYLNSGDEGDAEGE